MIGKAVSKGRSFKRPVQYIVKGASTRENGSLEVAYLQMASQKPEAAALEMQSVSDLSVRSREPVYHVVMSWPEGEDPTFEQALDAERKLAKELKVENHQRVLAVHRPKKGRGKKPEKTHIHIIYNKVHPDTLRTANLDNDYLRIVKTVRQIEKEQGWKQTPGPEIVQSMKVIKGKEKIILRSVPNKERESINQKARDFESHQLEKSFQTWVSEEPNSAVEQALKTPGCNWQTIHQTLASFNLRLETKGSGLIVRDRKEEKFVAKASQMSRSMSKSALEKKLGPFQESSLSNNPQLARTEYKRDPGKRLIRKSERDLEREKLFFDYEQYKNIMLPRNKEAWKKQRESEALRRNQLKEAARRERKIFDGLSFLGAGRELNEIRKVLAMIRKLLEMILKLEIAEERARLEKIYSVSYRDWLKNQAEHGSKAAQSALRGIRYKEGKEAKRIRRHLINSEVLELSIPA